ncbi:MAG: type II toxin-antitoxin system VapC family toxin [Acidobacteria bacterium]|nr:MAG: type II toxin-antitoxin system VapC family toxin [Acidobacteriota bacterium]
MKLLLDTSAFLWYLNGDSKLPKSVVSAVRSPDNDVWLSAVSLWEIVVKHALGKLPLPESPSSYIPTQRKLHAIDTLPLEEPAIVHLAKLPEHHRDPFDRMLICQAIEHEMLLTTSDVRILEYPVKTFWG